MKLERDINIKGQRKLDAQHRDIRKLGRNSRMEIARGVDLPNSRKRKKPQLRLGGSDDDESNLIETSKGVRPYEPDTLRLSNQTT